MKPLHLFLYGATLFGAVMAGFGQGTAFFYQGQLSANGSPANGSFDLTFTPYNAAGPVGGTLTNPATPLSNGLFSATLDFGPGIFNGSNLWLQIDVRPAGGGDFVPLTPMQPILSMPYAIMAATANIANSLAGPLPATQLSGVYSGDVTLDNAGNSFAGAFSGDGSGLTHVGAAALNGLPGSDYATLEALSNYAALDVLTNYATLASLSTPPGSSPIPNMQVFDSPGTTNFSVPAGVTRIAVEVWGGGGGGGNAAIGTGAAVAGAGGGAGGYGKAVFTVTSGDIYTVIVGAGGATAISGVASSFGELISAGGGSAGPSAPTGLGGLGRSRSAPINITGGTGQWTAVQGGSYGGSAGNGGSGGLGDSGSAGEYAGGSGQIPGGGGGGGFDFGDPGGPGAHGRVIVYY